MDPLEALKPFIEKRKVELMPKIRAMKSGEQEVQDRAEEGLTEALIGTLGALEDEYPSLSRALSAKDKATLNNAMNQIALSELIEEMFPDSSEKSGFLLRTARIVTTVIEKIEAAQESTANVLKDSASVDIGR